ncbi:hypothetical protein D3C72_2493530 [compost metagenome]
MVNMAASNSSTCDHFTCWTRSIFRPPSAWLRVTRLEWVATSCWVFHLNSLDDWTRVNCLPT